MTRHGSSFHRSLRQSSGFRPPRCKISPTDKWLQDTVDFSLLVALVAVPFLMGGRMASGQLVLTVSACCAAIAWALHQTLAKQATWTSTRAEFLLLAAVALALLQIVPLPAVVLEWLSPHMAKVLPAWGTAGQSAALMGPWNQLSLSPAASQLGLVTFLAYGLIFLVAAQRIRRVDDVERLLKGIGLTVGAMALFGIVQFATSNGKFYWFYEHPFTPTDDFVKGSFTNRNHFAQFLALGVGPLIWWLLRVLDDSRAGRTSFDRVLRQLGRRELAIGLLLVMLGVVAFANLRSLSRGGIIAMVLAALVTTSLLYRKGFVSGKLLSGLAAMALLVGGFLFINGNEAVAKRLDHWESEGRWLIWGANLEAISDYPIFGTGIGSHAEVYPMYLDQAFDPGEYTHAENGPLQVASETGLVGLTLAFTGVLFCFWWCFQGIRFSQSTRSTMALSAIAGSLIGNLVHSFVDFVWYAPGCMVVVVVLAACACRLYQMSRDARTAETETSSSFTRPVPRLAWTTASVGLVVLAGWMIQARLPSLVAEPQWHDYLRLTLLEGDQLEPPQRDADESGQAHRLRRKLMALSAAAKADRSNARIQLRMAMGYLSLFHIRQKYGQNPMTLAQIRDAAWSSEWESQQQLDEWLQRAVGENYKYLGAALRHTRRAMSLCPLQGQGYVYLAELGFIEGAAPDTQQVLLDQALTVRPYAAQILFVAGRDAWLAGDFPKAIEFWNAAFHRDEVYQQRIMDLLVGQTGVPAKFIIENFQPDLEALERLKDRFAEFQDLRQDDYRLILSHYAKAAAGRAGELKSVEAIYHWLYARGAYDELGDTEAAYGCLQEAYKIDPNAYLVRYAVGKWLYQQKRFGEAVEYLTWCSNRKPRDERLRRMTEIAVRERDHTERAGATRITQPPAVSWRR